MSARNGAKSKCSIQKNPVSTLFFSFQGVNYQKNVFLKYKIKKTKYQKNNMVTP